MHQGSRLPGDELLKDGDTHCYLLLLPLASKKPILIWELSCNTWACAVSLGFRGKAEVFLGTSSLPDCTSRVVNLCHFTLRGTDGAGGLVHPSAQGRWGK